MAATLRITSSTTCKVPSVQLSAKYNLTRVRHFGARPQSYSIRQTPHKHGGHCLLLTTLQSKLPRGMGMGDRHETSVATAT